MKKYVNLRCFGNWSALSRASQNNHLTLWVEEEEAKAASAAEEEAEQ